MEFLSFKEGGPNFCGEPILQKVRIIWSPLLYFNFKSFRDSNSLSLIRFQCILHDSGALFSEPWNIYKLKREDLISGGNQFCRKSELFDPPFRISILKVLWDQIHCYSFHLNTFCMIEGTFLRILRFLQVKEGGHNFWGKPNLQKVWIIWFPLLYLNFKSFVEPNS